MKIVFIVFILIQLSCGSQKPLQNNSAGTCDTEANVLDYTGLDGCRFLLELKDGTRLIPVELDDNTFLFSENQVIKIKYNLMKDVVTACLTSAVPVNITCIQEVKPGTKSGQEFLKRDCIDTETPLSLSWLNKSIIQNKVSEVKKGYINTTPYYILEGNAYRRVYTCKGDLVCEYETKTKSSCQAKFESLKDFKSIWAQK
ncbi:MAG: hypothetical protein ABI761_02395 [Saprospiraceae bacterium]